jgi:hypothetical protein
MKLTHEAVKNFLPKKYKKALSAWQKDAGNLQKASEFVVLFKELHLVHKEHAAHEDKVFFPALRSFFPPGSPHLATVDADDQHKRDHKSLKHLGKDLVALLSLSSEQERIELATTLVPRLEQVAQHMLDHFKTEENGILDPRVLEILSQHCSC